MGIFENSLESLQWAATFENQRLGCGAHRPRWPQKPSRSQGTSQRKTVGSSEDCGKLEGTCCIYRFPAFQKRTHRSSQMKHSCELDLAHGTRLANPACPSNCLLKRPLRVLGTGHSQASGSAAAVSGRALPRDFPCIPLPSPQAASPQMPWLIGFYLFYMRLHLRCLENIF